MHEGERLPDSGHSDNVELPEGVRPMPLSEAKLLKIAETMHTADWILDDDVKEWPLQDLAKDILQSADLILEAGDMGGAILVYHLSIRRWAEVAVMLWSKDWLGKPEEAKQVLKWLMYSFHLNRLTARLTTTNELALSYDMKLGFRHEGTHRHAYVADGEPRDVIVLGLLRKEVGLT